MKKGKEMQGITLVALVVTIVVLLILAGISLTIAKSLLIDKAIIASNVTLESSIKERIEMLWLESEASYLEKKDNSTMSKQDYFKQKLENQEDFTDIIIKENEDKNMETSFKYKNKEYTFIVSATGKANLIQYLKGNVKVGDYIAYPIEYDDVYSEKHYTAENGWRVIDDGVMEGTSGTVRIISTAVPAKWYYDLSNQYENSTVAIEELRNDFENLDLTDKNVENIKGSYFMNAEIAEKITTITLSDLNHAYNAIYGTNRKSNDTTDLVHKDNLLYLKNIDYWLMTASSEEENKIYCVNNEKIIIDSDARMGIRPVISLKEKQTGICYSNNVWKLED